MALTDRDGERLAAAIRVVGAIYDEAPIWDAVEAIVAEVRREVQALPAKWTEIAEGHVDAAVIAFENDVRKAFEAGMQLGAGGARIASAADLRAALDAAQTPPQEPGTDHDCPPVSPGQTHCPYLDQLMWARLTIEGQARRLAELEVQVQRGPIRYDLVADAVVGPNDEEPDADPS